jgi:16S rRNA (guanine527-N7)-methyltransferase
MDSARISALLQPFLTAPGLGTRVEDLSIRAGFSPGEPSVLSEKQLRRLSTYLDLLLRWNSRVNLTAVREPEAVITRHFGESLFVARCLFPTGTELSQPVRTSQEVADQRPTTNDGLIDFGSGAGFPGLPIKIWAPQVELTLIESNQKKATFLREVIRALGLNSAEVFSGRAEDFHANANIVTLRAVEKFERSLPVAASLVSSAGWLALLIGESQVAHAREIEPSFRWQEPQPIPLSSNRVLLIGDKAESG